MIWSSILSTSRSDRPVLHVGGREVVVQLLRHPQARGFRLRLARDGTARLTLPQRGSERRALAWAATQTDWIAAQLDRLGTRSCALADGTLLPLEGREVRICAEPQARRAVWLEEDRLIVGGPAGHLSDRLLRWLKARARDVLSAETQALAARHGLPLASVGIGDPVSRWGSCSASGAIRYSWRLILAPPEIRIATVAHEVAHLRHLDHSADFHAFHRAICPVDTVAARAWLRTHGATLHGVGRG